MADQNQRALAGLILAGGRGERLGGVIKSELVLGGVRLLELLLDQVRIGLVAEQLVVPPHAVALRD